VSWIAFTAIVGIGALAAGVQKWLLRACNQTQRWTLIVCGLLLIYPVPLADWIGLAGLLGLLVWQKLVRPAPAAV